MITVVYNPKLRKFSLKVKPSVQLHKCHPQSHEVLNLQSSFKHHRNTEYIFSHVPWTAVSKFHCNASTRKVSICGVFMLQLRKNVMDVSYHIVQYSNIITELREEIKRLRIKLDNQQSYGNKPSIQAVQCTCKLFPTK